MKMEDLHLKLFLDASSVKEQAYAKCAMEPEVNIGMKWGYSLVEHVSEMADADPVPVKVIQSRIRPLNMA